MSALRWIEPTLSLFGDAEILQVDEEQLREWAGLFDDTSDDDLLISLARAGEKKVRELSSGVSLSEAKATDYFSCFAEKMYLSSRALETDLTFSYINEENAIAEISMQDFFVDIVGSKNQSIIVYRESFPALSKDVELPVRVTFTTGHSDGSVTVEDLRQALRQYVFVMYHNRDQQKFEAVDIDSILLHTLSEYNLGIV